MNRILLQKKEEPATLASRFAWHNGEIKEREEGAPSLASISFHLGTGVFDGMMAYWNRDHYYIHRGEEHLDRLRRGASCMGLIFPWSVDDLMAGIKRLLELEPKGTQYVRPIVFRGAPELWVTGSAGRAVDVGIFTVRTETQRDIDEPISCEVSSVERISSRSIPGQVKVSGAYVNSFFARAKAEKSGFNDGIMFDREGRLAEASAANVFMIRGETLWTPPLNPDVFPGITRKVLLEIARSKGMDIRVSDIKKNDIDAMDGAFLCSTLMEIRGIFKLGERALRTTELPAYKTLVSAFRSIAHQ